jgi:hypothetical protein
MFSCLVIQRSLRFCIFDDRNDPVPIQPWLYPLFGPRPPIVGTTAHLLFAGHLNYLKRSSSDCLFWRKSILLYVISKRAELSALHSLPSSNESKYRPNMLRWKKKYLGRGSAEAYWGHERTNRVLAIVFSVWSV